MRSESQIASTTYEYDLHWGVAIPMRDGKSLSANLYLPRNAKPSPTLFTMTPYVAQTYNDRGVYFAEHGYPFLIVDVRGRGNSEGDFDPFRDDGRDGEDIVEWLAKQAYCDGQVGMWGGSYGGHAQWMTAARRPAHLRTIVPVASPFLGVDLPGRSNMPLPYLMQWLTLVWGRASQDRLFWNNSRFWAERFREAHKKGAAFNTLDRSFGQASAIFQHWVEQPHLSEFWDSYNPDDTEYAGISVPTLTITGAYDADQAGALCHYTKHLENNPRARHFLIIGPWDHAGTRTPALKFGGLEVGAASLLDIPRLHLDWYAWTMGSNPRPAFLEKQVAFYLSEADQWRYAESLGSITSHHETLYLSSSRNPTDVFHSGELDSVAARSGPDSYVYDPKDTSLADIEAGMEPESRVDQRLVLSSHGKHLVYHSAPLAKDWDVAGFFNLHLWMSIDQPDTDFRASVYDIAPDGSAVELATDTLRARYRVSPRYTTAIETGAILPYQFNAFTFIARRIKSGHRLRLIVGPVNSIFAQKNYNSGGQVSAETFADARPVTVQLFHDEMHPSALFVPIAAEVQ